MFPWCIALVPDPTFAYNVRSCRSQTYNVESPVSWTDRIHYKLLIETPCSIDYQLPDFILHVLVKPRKVRTLRGRVTHILPTRSTSNV